MSEEAIALHHSDKPIDIPMIATHATGLLPVSATNETEANAGASSTSVELESAVAPTKPMLNRPN
jgi:hypothetical protein